MAFDERLGVERSVELSAGTILYRERGSGSPIVLVHGVMMNADTWREAVPRLAEHYRCIAPDWPTGGHMVPLARDAQVTPSALAEMVSEFIGKLALEDVTLVGIGLGTVLCELICIRHPERVARIVFGSGDILSTFPPRWARRNFVGSFVPGVAWIVAQALRAPALRRRTYARFVHTRDDDSAESFTRGLRTNPGVRRDAMKLMRAIFVGNTGNTHAELAGFAKPALILWGADDTAFPARHPEALADQLEDVRIEKLDRAKTFLAQDQPDAFADAIVRFIASTPATE